MLASSNSRVSISGGVWEHIAPSVFEQGARIRRLLSKNSRRLALVSARVWRHLSASARLRCRQVIVGGRSVYCQ